MDARRLATSALRRARRDPVGVARTVWVRLRDDPAWLLVVVDRLVSTRLRGTYRPALRTVAALRARMPGSAALAIVAAFLLFGLRREHDLVGLLEERDGVARRRERLMLAALAAEAGQARAGLALLADLPDDGAVLRQRGRALWRAGAYADAVAVLEQAAEVVPHASTLRLLERARGDLAVRQAGWLPDLPTAPLEPLPGGPPRVLHLVNNSLPLVQAGYTVRTQRVALAQREAGLDPVFVTKIGWPWRAGFLDAAASDVVDGVTYLHVAEPDVATLDATEQVQRSAERFLDVVRTQRPAAMQPTTPFDNAQVALAVGRATGLPVVYEMRGFLEATWLSRQPEGDDDVDGAADRFRLSREVEGWCAQQAAAVVTLGEAMRDDLVDRGVPRERITVVPNAVDADRFQPAGRGTGLRRDLGIADDEVVLGYVSSLVAYEGVETLVEAVRLLADRGHRVRLLVVGDGDQRPALEHRASALGLDRLATFTGRVPHEDVLAYYEAIDVFVVPRRDDLVCRYVTPLKPVEAMALERTLVVSDLPALTETVEPGVTGLTFRPEDPADLADVVEPVLDDRDARERLGKAARDWVVTERTWARNAERYGRVYRDLGLL